MSRAQDGQTLETRQILVNILLFITMVSSKYANGAAGKLVSPEETTKDCATDGTRKPTCAEGVCSQIGSLAEFVTSGESQSIGDCEDDSDD